jgi:hypothetical protein
MGLIATKARISRRFTIASRSSVWRSTLSGRTRLFEGGGGSSSEEDATAVGCVCPEDSCLVGMGLDEWGAASLLQAATSNSGSSVSEKRTDLRKLWRTWILAFINTGPGGGPILIGMSQPRILPGEGNGLKSSAKAGESAIAVTAFYRLMPGEGDGDGPSNARIGL